MTAKLELHLKLDGFQVENRWYDGNGVVATRLNLVEDSSGNHHTSALFGNADIVADDAFGACADFDGDANSYVKIPLAQPLKITGDVTVEAWVYITKAVTDWVRVIGKGTSDSRSYGLWYKMTGTTLTCLFQRGQGSFDDCTAVFKTTPLNTWYHVAGVVEGKTSSLYVHDLKGKLIGKEALDHKSSGATRDNDSHVTIGNPLFPNHPAHAGRIAHARIYKGALSQAQIERDISSDRLALVPFRKSHPIDFHLNDEDDQPALYIVDGSADAKINSLKVELTNSATQAIHIPPAAPATDRDHHHFALRFRPGTLSASTIKKLTALTPLNQATVLNETDADHWELACAEGLTGPVTLYVSYKGPKSGQGDKDGKLFLPEEQLTLTLHGISADAGSGSRGTQVELIPHQLTYEGDDTPITGSRMRYIHITNHRGQKNIPLHVWLVDGNTVLNDGVSETKLKLRISNGSGDRDITLNERSSKEASKFVISFDVGEPGKADWALTDRTRANKVKVKHGERVLTRIDRGQGASTTFEEWELTFPQKTVLAKRGSGSSEPVEITLEGITTALSSGHANLYVRYEGIPGYQDGQFILTVEKSPLVFHKDSIGIGTADPQGKLHIKGHSLVIEGQSDNVGRNTPSLLLIDTHALKVDKAPGWGIDQLQDRFRIFSQNNNSLPFEKLTITTNGNVGICTGNPQELLQLGDLGCIDSYLKIFAGKGANHPNYPVRAGIKLECGQHNHGYAIAFDKKTPLTDGLVMTSIDPPLQGGLRFNRHLPDSHPTTDLFLDFRTGYVGIGTVVPNKNLDVRGELQVMERRDNPTPHIGTFYNMHKTKGIGIGYNQIAAIGVDQGIIIAPNGTGMVEVKGDLCVHGSVNGNLRVRGSLIIHTEGITTKEQAEKALEGTRNSIVFFVDSTDSPHLNWGFMDGKRKFHSSYAS